ncbi:hypothetical protein DS843_21260 [Roseomonas genomospecies 6]|uniref:Uncharacterized protein n=2 Tax=Roseomonas genomospecies 6 TaxID=214106 RepID=A0A9W7KR09_9PROT|nr:hypothetical protein DS843_21260 [Roseomonas genomospecies 6]
MAAQAARMSREQLMRQVKGLNRPAFDSIMGLAYAKGVSLDWLATGEGPMWLHERVAGAHGEPTGVVEPVDEALLTNLVVGVETFLVREDLILDPAPKARLMVLLYRMLARRRRELAQVGGVPPELREAGHPIDIGADPDLSDIVRLAG